MQCGTVRLYRGNASVLELDDEKQHTMELNFKYPGSWLHFSMFLPCWQKCVMGFESHTHHGRELVFS